MSVPDDELTRFAKALLKIRLSRPDRFHPGLFHGEQVWDMLLILFIADGQGERLTGRMVIDREGGSIEAGQRWLRGLTQLGSLLEQITSARMAEGNEGGRYQA